MNQRLAQHIKDNCTAVDTDQRYDEMLDEVYSFKSVGGPFEHMLPSRVLKECDPVAYRCGKNDWLDGQSRDGWVEVDDEYYDDGDARKARDELVSEMQIELRVLNEEIAEDEDGGVAREALLAKRNALEKEIEEIENEL